MAKERLFLHLTFPTLIVVLQVVAGIARAGSPDASLPSANHPLAPVLKMAHDRYDHLRRHVRDYSCTLLRKQLGAGEENVYHYIHLRVRKESKRQGRVAVPFSVYMKFLGPGEVKGRKVLYVQGKNQGKILYKQGGGRFRYATFRVSPRNFEKQMKMAITDLALDRLAGEVINRIHRHMKADPQGTNTHVEYFKNAKVGGRSCTRIVLTHPSRQTDLDVHQVQVYLDDQLQAPIRIEAYGWPRAAGAPPPLAAEITLMNLRVNVGLRNADFGVGRLQSS